MNEIGPVPTGRRLLPLVFIATCGCGLDRLFDNVGTCFVQHEHAQIDCTCHEHCWKCVPDIDIVQDAYGEHCQRVVP